MPASQFRGKSPCAAICNVGRAGGAAGGRRRAERAGCCVVRTGGVRLFRLSLSEPESDLDSGAPSGFGGVFATGCTQSLSLKGLRIMTAARTRRESQDEPSAEEECWQGRDEGVAVEGETPRLKPKSRQREAGCGEAATEAATVSARCCPSVCRR